MKPRALKYGMVLEIGPALGPGSHARISRARIVPHIPDVELSTTLNFGAGEHNVGKRLRDEMTLSNYPRVPMTALSNSTRGSSCEGLGVPSRPERAIRHNVR